MKRILLACLMMGTLCSAAQEVKTTFNPVSGNNDGYPMLSPDGKLILFESDRYGTSEIYVMDVDGKNLKQLTHNQFHDNSPKWSPDGTKIIFARERNDDSDIWMINADGTNEIQLTKTPGDDSHPNFSPDGTRIIFNSARSTPDLKAEWRFQWHEVFTMKIDGTDVKQISRFKTVSTYPSFSPDGTKICFRHVLDNSAGFNYDLSTGRRNSEVFVMNADGTNPVNVSNNAAYDGWPAWTPDGKVIFSSNRGGIPYHAQLYRVNSDGSNLELISDPKYSFIQATVTNDGKSIYCQHSVESDTFDYGGIARLELRK